MKPQRRSKQPSDLTQSSIGGPYSFPSHRGEGSWPSPHHQVTSPCSDLGLPGDTHPANLHGRYSKQPSDFICCSDRKIPRSSHQSVSGGFLPFTKQTTTITSFDGSPAPTPSRHGAALSTGNYDPRSNQYYASVRRATGPRICSKDERTMDSEATTNFALIEESSRIPSLEKLCLTPPWVCESGSPETPRILTNGFTCPPTSAGAGPPTLNALSNTKPSSQRGRCFSNVEDYSAGTDCVKVFAHHEESSRVPSMDKLPMTPPPWNHRNGSLTGLDQEEGQDLAESGDEDPLLAVSSCQPRWGLEQRRYNQSGDSTCLGSVRNFGKMEESSRIPSSEKLCLTPPDWGDEGDHKSAATVSFPPIMDVRLPGHRSSGTPFSPAISHGLHKSSSSSTFQISPQCDPPRFYSAKPPSAPPLFVQDAMSMPLVAKPSYVDSNRLPSGHLKTVQGGPGNALSPQPPSYEESPSGSGLESVRNFARLEDSSRIPSSEKICFTPPALGSSGTAASRSSLKDTKLNDRTSHIPVHHLPNGEMKDLVYTQPVAVYPQGSSQLTSVTYRQNHPPYIPPVFSHVNQDQFYSTRHPPSHVMAPPPVVATPRHIDGAYLSGSSTDSDISVAVNFTSLPITVSGSPEPESSASRQPLTMGDLGMSSNKLRQSMTAATVTRQPVPSTRKGGIKSGQPSKRPPVDPPPAVNKMTEVSGIPAQVQTFRHVPSTTADPREEQDVTSTRSFSSTEHAHNRTNMKMEVLASLMTQLGMYDNEDVSRTLLVASGNPESSTILRRAGGIALLTKVIHDPSNFNSTASLEIRHDAERALHNLVQTTVHSPESKRETELLAELESVRRYSELILTEDVAMLNSAAQKRRRQDALTVTSKALINLLKMTFDERYQPLMVYLGGVEAVSELLVAESHTDPCMEDPRSLWIRKMCCMLLVNTTEVDSDAKSLICSQRDVVACLRHLLSVTGDEELVKMAAAVIRNLSWRADDHCKQVLTECGIMEHLATCAQNLTNPVVVVIVLSAIWNLSAHNSRNRLVLCQTPCSIMYLVRALSSNNPHLVEVAGGILRNCAHCISSDQEFRQVLRACGAYKVIVSHLRSPNPRLALHACGILWNMAASSPLDQQMFKELGAVSLLHVLASCGDKLTAECAAAALRSVMGSGSSEVVSPNARDAIASPTKESPADPQQPAHPATGPVDKAGSPRPQSNVFRPIKLSEIQDGVESLSDSVSFAGGHDWLSGRFKQCILPPAASAPPAVGNLPENDQETRPPSAMANQHQKQLRHVLHQKYNGSQGMTSYVGGIGLSGTTSRMYHRVIRHSPTTSLFDNLDMDANVTEDVLRPSNPQVERSSALIGKYDDSPCFFIKVKPITVGLASTGSRPRSPPNDIMNAFSGPAVTDDNSDLTVGAVTLPCSGGQGRGRTRFPLGVVSGSVASPDGSNGLAPDRSVSALSPKGIILTGSDVGSSQSTFRRRNSFSSLLRYFKFSRSKSRPS